MIEVKGLYKSFEDRTVLRDINAKFYDGQVNQIIGKSGSGKTVLMKCIIGLFRPEAGSVEYDGRNTIVMGGKDIKTLRKEVGMLFQGSALFDSLSVLDNVMFPLRMFSGKTNKEMEARAKFCLSRVNILPDAYTKLPAEISGGMQKRVAIARAITLNPKYLFCDEPNSGLDPYTSLVIDRLIAEITKEYSITTIVNTHDMNSIMETGDNIILIQEGVKAWQGSRETIFNTDNQALNDFVFASDLFKTIRNTNKK